jgi:hypothetical protein
MLNSLSQFQAQGWEKGLSWVGFLVVLHSNDNQAFCSLDKLALYS